VKNWISQAYTYGSDVGPKHVLEQSRQANGGSVTRGGLGRTRSDTTHFTPGKALFGVRGASSV
jgi:hypothetical protein